MNELTPDEHKILVDAIQDSATVVHKGRKDMNERILELARQVWPDPNTSHVNHEKFAQLIVRECMNVVAKKCASPTAYNALAEHWEVEE